MMNAEELYRALFEAYGQPRWWSDDPYTVMVQSVLVQNTAWSSVEKVTAAMGGALTPETIRETEQAALEARLRPCGFAKRKTATIFALTEWFGRYHFSAEAIRSAEQAALRRELLAIKGVGAETADVILVFACHKPSFVIDAYTRRWLNRLGFPFSDDQEIRMFFERGLARDYRIYGWYHWLILLHGIAHCKKIPVCAGCVFKSICNSAPTTEVVDGA